MKNKNLPKTSYENILLISIKSKLFINLIFISNQNIKAFTFPYPLISLLSISLILYIITLTSFLTAFIISLTTLSFILLISYTTLDAKRQKQIFLLTNILIFLHFLTKIQLSQILSYPLLGEILIIKINSSLFILFTTTKYNLLYPFNKNPHITIISHFLPLLNSISFMYEVTSEGKYLYISFTM